VASPMTLRVYKIDQKGRVHSDTGTRIFGSVFETGTATSKTSVVRGNFPPCECTRCKERRQELFQ
jgi:hypothetical protein